MRTIQVAESSEASRMNLEGGLTAEWRMEALPASLIRPPKTFREVRAVAGVPDSNPAMQVGLLPKLAPYR